jgi:hypothetical protein
MSKTLSLYSKKSVVVFDPRNAKKKHAEADAVIKYAKQVQDWTLLEQAVDEKIEHQRLFVGWWNANIRSKGEVHKENPDRRFLARDDAEKLTGIRQQQVSRWKTRLSDVDGYRNHLIGYMRAETVGYSGHGYVQNVNLSTHNEYHIPKKYVEEARKVMGRIDLDPASCAAANKTVKAKKFYTAKDKGETQPWEGCLFINPPYGGEQAKFVKKLMAEMNSGKVQEAIILLSARCTETNWFQPLWDGLLCFTDHRLSFNNMAEGFMGSVFVYFGPNRAKFIKSFKQFGTIVEKVVA